MAVDDWYRVLSWLVVDLSERDGELVVMVGGEKREEEAEEAEDWAAEQQRRVPGFDQGKRSMM